MRESSMFVLVNVAGQCRWCGCTDAQGSWTNRSMTLCAACVPLDTAMRTRAGRRALAMFLQDAGFQHGRGPR